MKDSLVALYKEDHCFIYKPQKGYGANAFQIRNLLEKNKDLIKKISVYIYSGYAYIGNAGFLNVKSLIPEELNYYVKMDANIDGNLEETDFENIYVPINLPGTVGVYGHYLIDTLTRFELAKEILPKSKLGILLTDEHPSWVYNLIFSLFGEKVKVKKVRCEEVFNEKLLVFTSFREHDYISSISACLSKYRKKNTHSGRLIYVPRKDSLSRGLKNRDEVICLFKRKGFDIVYPELMDINEQIKLFSEVKVLAGEAGSALHNSIFSPPEIKIINIQSSRQSHFIQSGLCEYLGQEITFFWSQSESDDWLSDHEVDIGLLEQCIDNVIL